MRFKKLDIRYRIKDKAKRIFSDNRMPIVKLCLLLIGIYLVVEYIKIYAAPILQIKGDGVAALMNAYLQMSWQQILSIASINILAILIIGPLLCSLCLFFLRLTPNGLIEPSPEQKAAAGHVQDKGDGVPGLGQSMTWFTQGELRNKAILLRIATTLLSAFWHVLFVGPPLLCLYYLRGNPNSLTYTNALFVYTTWMLLGFLFAYVKNGTYYPAYFLIAQDPGMPVVAVLRDSVKMMKGHAWEFFSFKLSFIPWYLLSVLTFGLGLLYVVPYRGICDALFIRYIDTESSGENPI